MGKPGFIRTIWHDYYNCNSHTRVEYTYFSITFSSLGTSIHSLEKKSIKFNHALIVYGGVLGLEAAFDNDEHLDVDDPSLLFDHYLNVAPNQGNPNILTCSESECNLNKLI